MAEPDTVYSRDILGNPVKITGPNAAEETAVVGNRPISQQEAEEAAVAQKNLAYVDQNWGASGQLAYGALKGLTLGLGPGLAVQAGMLDPGIVEAANQSPYATAGDILGTVAPALLSGGESLAARGMALTPAGLMARGGGLAERFAGELLGGAEGLLGRAAATPLKMAARGATEGAIMNLGHQVGENMVQNQPLATEAIAALTDGALYGGLLGGGIGTLGALGEKAVEGASTFGRKLAGEGSKATVRAGKNIGYAATAEGIISGEADNTIRAMVKELRAGGSDIGEAPMRQLKAAKAAIAAKTSIREGVVELMDKQAPLSVPGFNKIEGPIWTDVIQPHMGTPLQDAVMKEAHAVRKELETVWKHTNIDPVKIPAVTEERLTQVSTATRPGKFSTVELEPGYEVPGMRVATGENPTWKELVKFRDEFAERATTQVRKDVLKILDSQIQEGMEAAGKGSVVKEVADAAKEYAASTMSIKVGKELESNLGKMIDANRGSVSVGGVSSKDIGVSAVVGASGSPLTAMGYLGAKGLGNQLQGRMESWLAKVAFDQHIGETAAVATQKAKERVSTSLDRFFKPAKKAVQGASRTAQKEGLDATRTAKGNKKSITTRAEYEAMADKVQTLLSDNHMARVQREAERVRAQGYQQLADAMLALNQRAVMYAMNNMPKRKGAQGMRSLRPIPVSQSLDLEEYRSVRVLDGIQNPLSLLDDLENGSLSSDKVRAAWNVNPELRNEVVGQAMEKIAEMKTNGDYLPMDKIAGLSILLDAPLDRIMEPDYVQAIQSSLAAPPQQQQNQPPAQSQPQAKSIASTGLLTATQNQMV